MAVARYKYNKFLISMHIFPYKIFYEAEYAIICRIFDK